MLHSGPNAFFASRGSSDISVPNSFTTFISIQLFDAFCKRVKNTGTKDM